MKSLKTAFFALGMAAFGLGATTAAQAQSAQTQGGQQVIESLTCSQIQQVLTSMGMESQCQTDNVGDPLVWSQADGVTFGIVTHGCNQTQDPRSCQALQFFAVWDGTASAEQMAAALLFNGRTLLGRSYINPDRELMVDMPLVVAGVTVMNVQQHIYYWRTAVLPEFVRNVVNRSGGGGSTAAQQDEEVTAFQEMSVEDMTRALSVQESGRKGAVGAIENHRSNPQQPSLPQ